MSKSAEIIAASQDLRQLHEDGFELSVKHAHLLVSSVPYVTPAKTVARGTLIFPLTMATDVTVGKPADHTANFAGEEPHYADGTPIKGMIESRKEEKKAEGIFSKFYFSSKPEVADPDYNVKVRRYVDLLSGPARVLEPGATAQTRQIVESEDDDSPLVYLDTNSARAQITPITDKLRGLKIAIVGLGGTGSYILDLVAKTPVNEIHLFDDDEFSLHNAYRAPGAPSRDQLRARAPKVKYLAEVYSRMHKRVFPHVDRITAENVIQLSGMNFVFMCMDPGPDKASLVEFLVSRSIPFVDTGIGVEKGNDNLVGIVNVITVTPEYSKHVSNVPVKAGGDDELYASNIQIAELNMFNAVMAVIRWKKYFGFYFDERQEPESCYTIGPNSLRNEEAHP
jgi:hypothetical protein